MREKDAEWVEENRSFANDSLDRLDSILKLDEIEQEFAALQAENEHLKNYINSMQRNPAHYGRIGS